MARKVKARPATAATSSSSSSPANVITNNNDNTVQDDIRPFSWARIDIVPTLYILILLGGGGFAFFHSGSYASLAASLICSFFMVIGTYKTSINKRDYYFSLSVCVCIFLTMGFRYLTTHKSVPCFVAIISLSLIIYLVGRAKDLAYDRDTDE